MGSEMCIRDSNNSGRSWGAPLEQFPWKAWQDVMTLNVTGLFTLTRELAGLLSKAGAAGDPARVRCGRETDPTRQTDWRGVVVGLSSQAAIGLRSFTLPAQ